MADYDSVSDPEALIQCPYDKFHMIRAKRLPYHLIKCKKNYAGNEFSVCPFNARHEMRKAELRYHMANCPDRARLETDFAYETGLISDYGTLFKGCTDVPAYHTNIQMKENWDQELSVTTRIGVHPDFFDNHQFKNLTGFTPEQKRQFYKNLKEGKNEFTDTSSHVEDEVRKLRVPHESSLAFKLMTVIPTDKPKPPDNVFLYSLTLAGIGRGKKLKQEE